MRNPAKVLGAIASFEMPPTGACLLPVPTPCPLMFKKFSVPLVRSEVVDRPRARRWSRICRLPETRDGTILGTIGYMAPEQVRGQPADQRSDIFSFGAVFYEMLTGRRAFRKADDFATMHAILYEPPPKLPARIPIRIARIVQRCLAMDPNQRYRTGGELAAALGRVAAIIQ